MSISKNATPTTDKKHDSTPETSLTPAETEPVQLSDERVVLPEEEGTEPESSAAPPTSSEDLASATATNVIEVDSPTDSKSNGADWQHEFSLKDTSLDIETGVDDNQPVPPSNISDETEILPQAEDEPLPAELQPQFPTIDDVKALLHAENERMQARLQSMIAAELVDQEHKQAKETLTTAQHFTQRLQTIKEENLRVELEALQGAEATALKNQDRPLRERWEEVDYIREQTARLEQDIADMETASARRLTDTAHILAELEGGGEVSVLRKELERHQQTLTALQDQIQQTETAKLTETPPAAKSNWTGWGVILAVVLAVVAVGLAAMNLQRESGPDVDLLLRLASLSQASGETEQAIEFLDEVQATGLNDAATLATMGQTYYALADYQQAIAILEQAIQGDPNNEETLLTLARAYGRTGQRAEAIVAYQQLLETNPVNWRYYDELGLQYEALPNYEQALAQYERVIEINPTSVTGYYRRGNVLKETEQYDDAIAAYRQALDISPTHFWSLINMGLSYEGQADYDQAMALYRTAIEINPENRNGYFRLGEASLELGNFEEAVAAYQQTLEISPTFANAQRGLGEAYLAMNDCGQATPAFLEALRLAPEDEAAQAGLNACVGQ